MDLVAGRDQVRAAWWQEKQDKVVDRSRCRVAAHDRSLHVGLRRFATKPSGYLVDPQNQDLRLARRAEMGSGHAEKLRSRGTHGDIAGLA
jgi:hypothetical protein